MIEQQDKLFEDEDAREILAQLYRCHPRASKLPMQNQKVLLLEQYQLITKAASQAVVDMGTVPCQVDTLNNKN